MDHNTRKPLLLLLGIFIWRMISGIRIVFFNLLFLGLIALLLSVWLQSRPKPIPDQAPLLISPNGVLVDQERHIDPTRRLINPAGGQSEVVLRELIRVIRFAAHDDRVPALLLRLDDLQGGGLSKLQELGTAIEYFKAAGKPVIAFSDTFDQQQYFLASYADEIYMHDLGYLMLTGYEMYRNYFKQAAEKISLDFHIFKVGEYKDFIEPYTRSDMSEESREHNSRWLEALWADYTNQVEQRRNLDSGSINHMINQMHDFLGQTHGNPTELALQMNLVDQVSSRPARDRALIERFGHMDDDEHRVRHINYERYSQALGSHLERKGNIGLIVARGVILDGHHAEGTIGGETLSQLIRQARQNDRIEALVLRIDSGGGSAFASEIIRQELDATRQAGKPVVISMGSTAASGGYWIAMGADEVWATPATLTGSIGVFGLFPNLEHTLAKIGVTTDGVATTDLAGGMRVDRPLSPVAANSLQQGVEFIYERFINLVAENRSTSVEEIHTIAQGRVWTGTHALELGLVDHLGYLDDAISAAAERAGIKRPQVQLIERPISPQEAMMRALLTQSQSANTGAQAMLPSDSIQQRLLTKLETLLEPHAPLLSQQQKGLNTLALCLGCVAP